MDQAIIYTDGGCSGNPGPGGYAYVISLLGGAEEVLGSGGEANTTNNRMELRAVISALSEDSSAARPAPRPSCAPTRNT